MAEGSESQDGEQAAYIAGMSKEEFAARFKEVTGEKTESGWRCITRSTS
ncbi:MAG: hypothetical protein QF809_00870 [Candidatus Peribacteraceae bacterium]|nr:hypothetical protein [Candidatus Peribacteraceae bacterium]